MADLTIYKKENEINVTIHFNLTKTCVYLNQSMFITGR